MYREWLQHPSAHNSTLPRLGRIGSSRSVDNGWRDYGDYGDQQPATWETGFNDHSIAVRWPTSWASELKTDLVHVDIERRQPTTSRRLVRAFQMTTISALKRFCRFRLSNDITDVSRIICTTSCKLVNLRISNERMSLKLSSLTVSEFSGNSTLNSVRCITWRQ